MFVVVVVVCFVCMCDVQLDSELDFNKSTTAVPTNIGCNWAKSIGTFTGK